MDGLIYERKGYLLENFRLFRLRDTALEDTAFHYHEFHKLLFFISGRCVYSIEGKRSPLEGGDIVVVGRGCVHRAEVDSAVPYERVILYISPDFLRAASGGGCDLESCFSETTARGSHVLRPAAPRREKLLSLLAALERALADGEGYGAPLLARLLMTQLALELCRCVRGGEGVFAPSEINDEKTVEILRYINENLTENISIDALSERFFVSKYHMMRMFRAETGSSIHGYVSDKRLLLARSLMAAGENATTACYKCGYRDYSSFSRAYRKQFGASPRGRSLSKNAEGAL